MTTEKLGSEATLSSPEREQLEAFLQDPRAEVLALLDGVTQEQATRRLVPSLSTLLGLVTHTAFVEGAGVPALDLPAHDSGARPARRTRRHPA